MRAFRPSFFARFDQEAREELRETVRRVNVVYYQKRVQAGLPLFDTFPGASQAQGDSSSLTIPTDR